MKNRNAKQGRTEIERARQIHKSLGLTTAALYLAKRNWSVEAAVYILLGSGAMKHIERNRVPSRNDPWVQWARAILLLFAAAVLLASISGCQPRVGDKSPSGYDPVLYVDSETGCNYLSTGSTNALTPRMDRNGKQVCR